MRSFLKLILLVLAVAFLVFVWPTRFAHTTVGTGEFARPARMDRFTGEVQVKDAFGRWRPIGRRDSELWAPAPFERRRAQDPLVVDGRRKLEQARRDQRAMDSLAGAVSRLPDRLE
jgi:hypothetical protein